MEYMSKIKNKFNRTLLFILVCLFPFASQAEPVPFKIKVHGTIYYFFANETAIDNKEMTNAIFDLNRLLAKQENYCQRCRLFTMNTYPISDTNLRMCHPSCSSTQDNLQIENDVDAGFYHNLSRIYKKLNHHSYYDFRPCVSFMSDFTIMLHKKPDYYSEDMTIETIKPTNSCTVREDISSVQTETYSFELKRLIDQNDDEALEKIKKLISINPNCLKSNCFYSPIAHAATKHHEEIFDFILNCVKPNEHYSEDVLLNICHCMEGEQRISRCKGLINAKWNMFNGGTSLLETLVRNQTVDFSFLFEAFPKQCHIDYSDKQNFWFFATLVSRRNTDMIRFVLDNQEDFDPKLMSPDNASYITFALIYGRLDIACELLTRYPAAARISSSLSGTPLQTMSSPLFNLDQISVEDYKKVINLLTKHGANINETTPFYPIAVNGSAVSRTPLQLAIDHLNVNYIQALLECDANPKDVQSGEPNLLNLVAAFFMKSICDSKAIEILNLLKSHFEPCEWLEKNADKMSAMDYILQKPGSADILKQLNLTQKGEYEEVPEDAMEI